MSLFKERRFLPYFLTQFLGAFNDNIFKNALLIIVTYHLVLSSVSSDTLVNLAAMLFILPFFLFSPLAGQLAEKYEKSLLIRRIKMIEILLMILGAIGLYLQSVPWLLFVLFLMGAQSTFFGPIKYSILPQSLNKKELLHGNALVEAGTFLAILLGTILGAVLANDSRFATPVSIAIIVFAVLGRLCSQWVPEAKSIQPHLRLNFDPISSGKEIFQGLKKDHAIFLTAIGISWFWFFGATFLTQFTNLAKNVFNGSPLLATLFMAMFSIGIAIGSFLCSKMAGKKVELGIVPIGAIGLTLAGMFVGTIDIQATEHVRGIDALFDSDILKMLLGLLVLAISGGLFIVPMYAYIQSESSQENLSRNIAALNMLNAAFMAAAAIFAIFVLKFGNSIQGLFFITAVMNAVISVYIFHKVPDYIVRFGAWLLVHSLYRVDKQGLANIPAQGAAVLACNHVSFVDPIIVSAVMERRVRFVMYYKIYQLPVIHYLFKLMGAIPIASAKQDAELLDRAYEQIAEALQQGELVCIFPEGGLTPDGDIQPFKHGIEKILKRTPVPVVPMALKGLWGTWFSRKKGRAMKGLPRNWMKKIHLVAGELIDYEQTNLANIEARIRLLRADQP